VTETTGIGTRGAVASSTLVTAQTLAKGLASLAEERGIA